MTDEIDKQETEEFSQKNYDELIKLLDDPDSVTIIAADIIDIFKEKANTYSLEVDYHLTKGKMVSPSINTEFRFNSREGDLLNKMSKLADNCGVDEKLINKITTFENKLKKELSYKNKIIKSKIRETIPLDTSSFPENLQDKIKEIYIPLNIVQLKKVELNLTFNREADGGYTINVRKRVPKNYKYNRPVSNELISDHIATGKSYEDLIQEKQDEGDPAYTYIEGVVKKYYESEGYLGFYVDYSMNPQEESLKRLEEFLPNWRDYVETK